MWKKRAICCKCGKRGRLERQSGDIYRMNHDFTKNGKKTRQRCYLGNLHRALKKFEIVPKIRNDVLIEDIYNQILDHEKNNNLKQNSALVLALLKLNAKLGHGWVNERHYLLKQDNCPYCKKKIAVRYMRIGKNPNYSDGKYNIDKVEIKKGMRDRTSEFKNKFTGRLKNNWELGTEKGNPDMPDIFYEDG